MFSSMFVTEKKTFKKSHDVPLELDATCLHHSFIKMEIETNRETLITCLSPETKSLETHNACLFIISHTSRCI